MAAPGLALGVAHGRADQLRQNPFRHTVSFDEMGSCGTGDGGVVVLEGEMEFELEGEVHRPPAGEELLIPAGCVHPARNIGGRTARWLYGYRAGRS